MIRRFVVALRQQDWLTVFIELVVVVLGIFLALQADSWNDARLDREKEADYLVRIHEALQNDLAGYDRCLLIADSRRGYGELILAAIDDPDIAARQPGQFFNAVRTAGWSFFPMVDRVAFEELKFNGELGILSDIDFRTKLVRYYAGIEFRSQFNGVRAEDTNVYRTFLGSLLLPDEQYRMVDAALPNEGDIGEAHFTPSEALALVERVRANEKYIQNIPILTAQGGIIFTCIQLQTRARELVSMLERGFD